jgi:hypothetical protein
MSTVVADVDPVISALLVAAATLDATAQARGGAARTATVDWYGPTRSLFDRDVAHLTSGAATLAERLRVAAGRLTDEQDRAWAARARS